MAQWWGQPRVAIVGLGNVLLMDDGVGVHAVRELMDDTPQGVTVAEIGTRVLDALELFESVDLVVAIDAVSKGDRPGSIYHLDLTDADVQGPMSLHEFGIAAAMDSLPVEFRPEVTIVGVEPAVIDYGMQLSPAVQAVLGQVVHTARSIAMQRMCKTTGGRT